MDEMMNTEIVEVSTAKKGFEMPTVKQTAFVALLTMGCASAFEFAWRRRAKKKAKKAEVKAEEEAEKNVEIGDINDEEQEPVEA